MCSLLTEAFYYPQSLLFFFFFDYALLKHTFLRPLEASRNALSMAHQPNVGRACGWLVSAVFCSWVEKSSDFADRFRNEKWNARAHSVHAHLQHFQSQRSYRAHSLSSVAKSSLRQLDMHAKCLFTFEIVLEQSPCQVSLSFCMCQTAFTGLADSELCT